MASFNLRSPIGRLRLIGLLEGSSLLLLLFVAMPLKYLAGKPDAVRLIGWAHGLLFVLFLFMAFQAYLERQWPFKKLVWAGLAAFLPFGTFLFDRQLKKEEM